MTARIVHLWALILFSLEWLQAESRRVNVSSAWYLPDKKSPVFYRYFSEKVTWNEAEAICGYHHADLLSVQTSAQMDAARAYLKDLDVTDNVWIGLQRESAEKPFISNRDANQNFNVENIYFSNGEKVPDDGYWLQPIPKTNDKLCVALDPVSDFRWNAYYCDGSQVFSFVCELPIPDWVKKDDGCLITSLSSLIITYIPEMEIVQLFSDCGLDGTRRIACKSGMNHRDMAELLACEKDLTSYNNEKVFGRQSDLSKGLKSHQTNNIQLIKSWALRVPQTRHKRSTKSENFSQNNIFNNSNTTQTESFIETTPTSKINTSKFPFQNPPHSPDKNNVLTTVATSTSEMNRNLTISSRNKSNGIPENVGRTLPNIFTIGNVRKIESKGLTVKPYPQTLTQVSLDKASISESIIRPPTQATNNEVPFSRSTGEIFNDLLRHNKSNVQMSFKTDEIDINTENTESLLIPVERDLAVNSFSPPTENDNVDLIDLVNATMTTESTQKPDSLTTASQMISQKTIVGLHPLRLGENRVVVQTASTAAVTTTTTSIPILEPVITNADDETAISSTRDGQQRLQNIPESEIEDEINVRQRPSRGRVLTHSNIPSFYPYLFSKVLG